MSSAIDDEHSENNNPRKQCLSYLEESFHSAFVDAKASAPCYGELTKQNASDILDSYCNWDTQDDTVPPLVLCGPTGVGKSANLANWILRRKSNRTREKDFLFFHFAGCSRNSKSVGHTLRRLMKALKEHFDLGFAINPDDERLVWELPQFLQSAAKKGRIYLIIDGVHRMVGNDGEYGIRWLPQHYPKNVRVIITLTIPSAKLGGLGNTETSSMLSSNRREKEEKILHEIQRRKWNIVEVGTFDEAQIASVVNDLELIAQAQRGILNPKSNDSRDLLAIPALSKERLLSKPEAFNPLFLSTLLRSLVYAELLGYEPLPCWERWSVASNNRTLLHGIMDTFESCNVCRREVAKQCNLPAVDPHLGRALALLYVSRHGLYRSELQDMLTRQSICDRELLNVNGRVNSLKVQIFSKLFDDKKRLIDIFRSFDKDRDGLLSFDEFRLGLRQLEIDADEKDIVDLVVDIDANHDGKLDYRETLDNLEESCRHYIHGVTMKHFGSSNPTRATTLSSMKPIDIDFETLYRKLFCLGVLPVGDDALTLPLENEEIRSSIWSRYIDSGTEEKWRLFLVNYFSAQDTSLRRCEELLWHLSKCRRFASLKHTILDLRTFDIMYNDELFKQELGVYLMTLTKEGTSLRRVQKKVTALPPASIQEVDLQIADAPPFDLVHELNHAVELWYHGVKPSAERLAAMVDLMANFLQWFDEKHLSQELTPSLMRQPIIDCFEKIGDRDGKNGIRLKNMSVGKTFDLYVKNIYEQASSKAYLLDRWMWIQFPWILIRACELAAIEEGMMLPPQNISTVSDTDEGNLDNTDASQNLSHHVSFDCARVSNTEQSTHATRASSASAQKHLRLAAKSTEGVTSLQSNKIREKARANAEVSKKSARVQKVDRLELQKKQEGTRAKASCTSTTTCQKLKTQEPSFTRGDDLGDISPVHEKYLLSKMIFASELEDPLNEHFDSLLSGAPLNSSSKEETSMLSGAHSSTQDELQEASLSRQLGNIRDLHDGLVLELQQKKRRHSNLEQLTTQERLGETQSGKDLDLRGEIMNALQPRLEKICRTLEFVSRLGELYESVESKLVSCDPTADKKRLQSLEQQIALSRQQMSDMKMHQSVVMEETDRIAVNVLPRWRNELSKLQSKRQAIETKVDAVRAELYPPLEDDANGDDLNTKGKDHPFDQLSLRQMSLRSSRLRLLSRRVTCLSASRPKPIASAEQTEESNICLTPLKNEKVDTLNVLLEATGSLRLSEAAARINASQELMRSQSIHENTLANEVACLKHKLGDNCKRLEALRIGANDAVNDDNSRESETRSCIASSAVNDAATWDDKSAKRMNSLNQVIQTMKTGIGHINRMLLGLKLEIGSKAVSIGTHLNDEDEDVRKMRQAGFLLLHVIDTMKTCKPLSGKHLELAGRRKSSEKTVPSVKHSAGREEISPANALLSVKLMRAKQSSVLLPAGKDEIRIKTRNEAELHFETEMRQASLKHQEQDLLIDRKGYDRDTIRSSESIKDGMVKFISDALSTSESKMEQRRANILGESKLRARGNKGVVIENIMRESKLIVPSPEFISEKE